MKAEAFTGAAQRINTGNYCATENKALITAAVFLLMYSKLGWRAAMGCMIREDRKSVPLIQQSPE